MKVAVVGSRDILIENLEEYMPENVSEIISGGAKGVDTCAEEYANKKGIKVTVIKPEYSRYGRGAPIIRNKTIVDLCDVALIFWNGTSKGTKSVIDYCEKTGKKYNLYTF